MTRERTPKLRNIRGSSADSANGPAAAIVPSNPSIMNELGLAMQIQRTADATTVTTSATDITEHKTMDKTQLAFLEARFTQFYVQGWDELLAKLKSHGGKMLVPMPEPAEHVQWLLNDGRIFNTSNLKLQLGEEGRCHENASRIWAEAEGLHLVTGYALDLDGELWSLHSWVWDPATDAIIETTEARKQYFGVVLNDNQALKFTFENVENYSDPSNVPPLLAKRTEMFLFKRFGDLTPENLLKKIKEINQS